MRYVVLSCLLASSTLACSQITIVSGYATNDPAVPGVILAVRAQASPSGSRLRDSVATGRCPNATAGNAVGVSSFVGTSLLPAFKVRAQTTPRLNLGAAIPESAYGAPNWPKDKRLPRPGENYQRRY